MQRSSRLLLRLSWHEGLSMWKSDEALTEARERLPMLGPMAFHDADGLLGPVKLNVR